MTKSIIILACVLVLFSPLLYHSSYPLLGITLFLSSSIHYPLSLLLLISSLSHLIFHNYLPLQTNNLPSTTSSPVSPLYHPFLSSSSQQTSLKGLSLCYRGLFSIVLFQTIMKLVHISVG